MSAMTSRGSADAGQRIVVALPLTELWSKDGRRMDAVQLRPLDQPGVVRLMREGPVQFIRADVGHPLEWIPAPDRFDFWKSEVRDRVADPAKPGFALDDFPGGYGYTASLWQTEGAPPVILLERHH